MIAFIDDHRGTYGVEPICRVLPMAPSSYHAHKARAADPLCRLARVQRDARLQGVTERVWKATPWRVRRAENLAPIPARGE